MDSPSLAPSTLGTATRRVGASPYRTIIALGLIVYGWVLGTHMAALAGGSDSSGYFNQARLLSEHATHVAPRAIADFAPKERSWVYSPLGFKPSSAGDSLVPTYPTGLPLWIAATAKLTGWSDAGTIVAWLHAIAGVALVYAAGRTFGLGHGTACAAAAIVGTSPVYLLFGLQAMSDVPALVWASTAVLCAWRSRERVRWAGFAGIAFAMAVLVRPTNALALVPIAVGLGFRVKPWLAFGIGGIPGAIFFVVYSRAAYGGWLTTGYGDLNLAGKWIGMTIRHYAVWLPVVFSPAIIGIVLLPWAGRGRERLAWMLALWFFVFAGFYSAYNCTHETWWYLRFLLPAAPALILASMIGFDWMLARWPSPRRRWLAFAGVVVAVACNLGWTRHWYVLRVRHDEEKYALTSQWLQQRIPRNAVVACMQQSGALYYDTDFTIVRWDFLSPSDFEALAQTLQKQGRPLYAALFRFEIESERAFELHLRGGNWRKLGQIREVTMWQWTPTPSS